MATTWYAQATGSASWITWNDASNGNGNGLSWPPTAGDTLDANGYDIALDADVEVILTAVSGTWALGTNPTFYADITVQCPVYSAASVNIHGTWTLADTLTTEQISIWGTVTISGAGAISATTIIMGPNGQISDIDACEGAIQGVAPDWPDEAAVLDTETYDNGAKTGTFDLEAAEAAAAADQLATDQATVLASADYILTGHSILDQAGTYTPDTAGGPVIGSRIIVGG